MANLGNIFRNISVTLIFCALSFPTYAESIQWEIEGRFRLIRPNDSESEKQLYKYSGAAELINCAVDDRACEFNIKKRMQ